MTATKPSAGTAKGVLSNIQGLRAAAALLVVFHHMQAAAFVLHTPRWFVAASAQGVDLFFAISGFIMVFTTSASHVGAARFLKNRLARVVPLYWLMTLLVVAISPSAPQLLGKTHVDLADVLRSLAFIPYARGDGDMVPVFFLGWSLNYEMFFYLVFAASLWATKTRAHVWIAVAVIGALLLAGLIVTPGRSLVNFYTSPRMAGFVTGMLVALLFPHIPAARTSAMLGLVAGFAWLMAGTVFAVAPWTSFSAAGASMLILVSALAAEKGGVILRWPVVLLLGDASYSLYLSHPLVAQLVIKGWEATRSGMAGASIALVTGLLLSGGVAILVYRKIEMPMTRAARTMLGTRPQPLRARGL